MQGINLLPYAGQTCRCGHVWGSCICLACRSQQPASAVFSHGQVNLSAARAAMWIMLLAWFQGLPSLFPPPPFNKMSWMSRCVLTMCMDVMYAPVASTPRRTKTNRNKRCSCFIYRGAEGVFRLPCGVGTGAIL